MESSPPPPASKKIVVTVPTYNESANIERLIDGLLRVDPALEVLVADDDSPDGTWRIVARLAESNPRVHLLHRTHDRGRGAAGRHAFRVALDMGATIVVEMDADLSHSPDDLPRLLAALDGADLVIGSRLVPGGADVGRGVHRTWITRLSNFVNRTLLRVPVRDCNSGYRIYRRDVLERIELPTMVAVGPEIVPEVLIRARRRGFRIVEVPIRFVDRVAGESNLTLRKLVNVLRFSLRLAWRDRTGRLFDPPSEVSSSRATPSS